MQRRFGDLRPGMTLLAVENAGLPITIVGADVLAQERLPLPIVEQFVLRLVGAGVSSVSDVSEMLGIGEDLVLDATATQVSEGNIANRRSDSLALTPMGSETALTLASTRPVLKPLPVVFDRLTWRMTDYRKHSLVQKKEAQELGLLLLPAAHKSRIGLDDITAEGINALLRAKGDRESQIEVLRVRKVSPNTHRYLPVQLLVYGDAAREEVALAVCIDDELSAAHTGALDAIAAVEKLGLSFEPPSARPVLDHDLEEKRLSVEDVDRILTSAPAEIEASGPDQLDQFEVRAVSVFEHPDLLTEALESARSRILLIAPWVRDAVVTTEFLGRLEGRLKAGVKVSIAHGYGKDDSGSSERALARLANLQKRYKDRFDLARLSDNHAKILIFDDVWINTSFNWLSFRGDPERTYRMEEGTLVRIPERVEGAYERYLQMIEDLRVG